jgi:hypothetical protein
LNYFATSNCKYFDRVLEAVLAGLKLLDVDGCENWESWEQSVSKFHKYSSNPCLTRKPWGLVPGVDLDEVLTDEGGVVIGLEYTGLGGSWISCSGAG